MMEIKFHPKAKKEFAKLDDDIRKRFDATLRKIAEDPTKIPESNKLHGGLEGCYKIKFRSIGYRMVYEVKEDVMIIYVLSVGKRDKSFVYSQAIKRRV
jgi:addiction module toxin, relE/stbE family